jgi:heme oxygenase (mycobilin-producing)
VPDAQAAPDPRATPTRPADASSGRAGGRPLDRFVVVNRYRVEPADQPDFLDRAAVALEALAARPGFVTGEVARSTDDPDLLAMLTRWREVGAYRRALSDHRVKATAVPLMYLCVDEPGAYEVVLEAADGTAVAHPSDLAARPSRQPSSDR